MAITAVLDAIGGILPRLFTVIDALVTDRDAAEKLKAELKRQAMDLDHAEQMAIYAQFAAEFGKPGLANQIADGLNRFVRPS